MLEVVRPGVTAANAKVAIFDFDGTLSLIRSGWIDVMVPLCVAQLRALHTGETDAELGRIVEEFVWRLTGKETIYQMMALADAIRERGGEPLAPLAYKQLYLDALWLKIRERVEGLRSGSRSAREFLVPGAREFLDELIARGLRLFLASGTDDANVKEEAALLRLSSFFGDRIYGARDDLNSFSKAMLVQRILSDTGAIRPSELVVFGDGFVEVEEVKKVGGVAIGLATSEPDCLVIDTWKRDRLVSAGADFIAPNYLGAAQLSAALFGAPALVSNR